MNLRKEDRRKQDRRQAGRTVINVQIINNDASGADGVRRFIDEYVIPGVQDAIYRNVIVGLRHG